MSSSFIVALDRAAATDTASKTYMTNCGAALDQNGQPNLNAEPFPPSERTVNACPKGMPSRSRRTDSRKASKQSEPGSGCGSFEEVSADLRMHYGLYLTLKASGTVRNGDSVTLF
jgi:hypothetical protein